MSSSFHWTAGNAVLQGQPVQKFHGDERLPILLRDFIDGADVGMVESRGRLRLTLETDQRLGISGQSIGQKLQRHESVQGYVLSFVDHTHAAAQLLDDAVVRDGSPDHSRILRG